MLGVNTFNTSELFNIFSHNANMDFHTLQKKQILPVFSTYFPKLVKQLNCCKLSTASL